MVAVARRTVPKSSGSSGECARDEREVGRKYNPRGTLPYLYLLIADPGAKPDGVRAKIVLGSCLGVENDVFFTSRAVGIKVANKRFWRGRGAVGDRSHGKRPGTREKEIEFDTRLSKNATRPRGVLVA